ncbi:hypothetical protein CE11_00109 [Megavirus courdo11]|uniref:Uncharacterized protein n=1 Tax=Megavirus courdo11 TaxID=1128140 RepID=K7Z7C4_9VIRU|nr:hypothetical protein CE11_00109 [Megavirus courdo11]
MSLPDNFRMATDIDIINNRLSCVVRFPTMINMTAEIFTNISKYLDQQYDEFICQQKCHVCNSQIDNINTLYTNINDDYNNPSNTNINICSFCLDKAFQNVDEILLPGFIPGPVYSLGEICRINGKKIDDY